MSLNHQCNALGWRRDSGPAEHMGTVGICPPSGDLSQNTFGKGIYPIPFGRGILHPSNMIIPIKFENIPPGLCRLVEQGIRFSARKMALSWYYCTLWVPSILTFSTKVIVQSYLNHYTKMNRCSYLTLYT